MTVREAIKRSGTPVALSGASIDAAEDLLARGEKVTYAVVANCTVTGQSKASGALVVTSHRILFCTSTLGKVRSTSLLLQDCVGVGDITGKMLSYKMPFTSEGTEISVELTDKKWLTALQAAALAAIADYPNHAPIDFTPAASDQPAPEPVSAPAPAPSVDSTIKICRGCGDRLLAGARKCPTCGSKDLVELDRDDSAGIEAAKAQAGRAAAVRTTPVSASMPLTKRGQAKQRITENRAAGVACCPKCGSTSLSANKKGFSLGKAAAGAFVAGPVGLVGGTLGANKLEVTCLNCGHKFKPGQK